MFSAPMAMGYPSIQGMTILFYVCKDIKRLVGLLGNTILLNGYERVVGCMLSTHWDTHWNTWGTCGS